LDLVLVRLVLEPGEDRLEGRDHLRPLDAIILAVKHNPILQLGEAGIEALLAPDGLTYDLKGVLPPGASHARI
jgi:hypothetical protein